MSDYQFIANLKKAFGYDHKKAANQLGVSYSTYKRYYSSGDAPQPVKNLASIIARGYLPTTGPWADFYIDSDGILVTPYGSLSAGDAAFHHRKKWAANYYQHEYKKLKEKQESDQSIQDIQDKLLELVVYIQGKTG